MWSPAKSKNDRKAANSTTCSTIEKYNHRRPWKDKADHGRSSWGFPEIGVPPVIINLWKPPLHQVTRLPHCDCISSLSPLTSAAKHPWGGRLPGWILRDGRDFASKDGNLSIMRLDEIGHSIPTCSNLFPAPLNLPLLSNKIIMRDVSWLGNSHRIHHAVTHQHLQMILEAAGLSKKYNHQKHTARFSSQFQA